MTTKPKQKKVAPIHVRDLRAMLRANSIHFENHGLNQVWVKPNKLGFPPFIFKFSKEDLFYVRFHRMPYDGWSFKFNCNHVRTLIWKLWKHSFLSDEFYAQLNNWTHDKQSTRAITSTVPTLAKAV